SMNKVHKRAYDIILFLLGIVATAMIFLPALIYRDSDTSFLGYEVVFGTEFVNLGIFGSGQLEPIVLGMFAFALPLAAGITAVLFKRGALVSALLFIGGAIMLFLLPTFTIASVTILDSRTVLDVTWTMGAGLIVAGVASSCGAAVSLVKAVIVPE
ncbi:MAG: hypothetical protein NTV44_03640, partial [Firmicutes bacterium]|nr:hypothetical protein [Bacillota bacterium]